MPILSLPFSEAKERLRCNRTHSRWWFADNLPADLRALGAAERLKAPIFAPLVRPSFRLRPQSRIFTIGSCFAREIEDVMLRDGLSVTSNPEVFTGWEPREPAALAGTDDHIFRMGFVNKYTIGTMVDELRWGAATIAAEDHPAVQEIAPGRFVDLAAHNILVGDDEETVRRRRAAMTTLMRGAFEAEVVVVTLGLTEGWRDSRTDIHLVDAAIALKAEYPDRFTLDVLSHAENLAGLREIAALLDRYGQPGWRMLLSVSPVPFLASFTGDDVVVANTYSKAVLRAAAEEFTRENDRVDYFPSYEMAMYSDPALVWESDRRHIRRDFVQTIIGTFRQHYLAG